MVHDADLAEGLALPAAGIAHVIETGEGNAGSLSLSQLLADTRAGHTDVEVTLDDPAAIL